MDGFKICPKCGTAEMVEQRRDKRNKTYICPKCDFIFLDIAVSSGTTEAYRNFRIAGDMGEGSK